jgi:RND superfamily putative drug exporter
LIDATIVRGVLLPASMKLLGDWNWYLPSWLGWLPKMEPHALPAPKPIAAAAQRRPAEGQRRAGRRDAARSLFA